MRMRRVVIGAAAIFAVAFATYLGALYQQLQASFARQEQFIPTRIYSDVARIAPPQPKTQIEARLKALSYTFDRTGGDRISFRLHPRDYPDYLVPEGHPQATFLAQAGQPGPEVILQFDSDQKDALLQAIQVDGREIGDIYLEPELVATLSRGPAGPKAVRELIKFDEIPARVYQPIIAIEDQHFLEHKGLDPRGLARAIWVNLRTRSFAQGGSTITQQLVKNLMARRTKNVFRKINEVFLALLLETKFDKEEILERYLNEVYLGQIGNLEVHGVAEGAKHFFGKRLEELNLAETALMAGLIRGPAYYSPYRYKERAIERQRLVLKKMVETGMIAEGEAKAAMRMPIHFAPPQTVANKAPYFNDFVKAELIRHLKDRFSEQEITDAGFQVYTTLDLAMNSAAQQAVAAGVGDLEKRMGMKGPERLEGALAAVDHSTGYIRALVGGRSYAQSTFNRILNMKRQVGSTFKPIVYLTAIQKGEDPNGVAYGPGHPAEDAPWKLVYDRGKQEWAPHNYEKEYMGWISYRKALAHSVNTIAAKVGVEVGIENVVKTARALGIESELPAVPSLSLGVAELSPIELLKVYSVFANHGVQDELTVIRGITQQDGTSFVRFVYHPKEVFDAGPLDLLTDMLQSVFSEGTAAAARKMGFDRPAAGKTGTTSNHRDSWFAGYTPQLTAVVWVGMDQSGPGMGDDDNPKAKKQKVTLTGASSALPIWVNFMNKALEGEPPAAFSLSPNVSNVLIDQYSGKQALTDCPASQTLVEKYLKGREPKQSSCEALWPVSSPKTVEQ